ncbi:LCP family protein [Coleofasciculus sp. FACHB-SPT36]|uniref:LCP family protein n=1 Tax=Cyanophyceae TaxID=3028117 RepID=UPI00321F935B
MEEGIKQSQTSPDHETSKGSSNQQAPRTDAVDDDSDTSPQSQTSDVANEVSPQKNNLGRRLLWIAVFIITATVSATVGATLALITPLSPIVASQTSGEKTATDGWGRGFQYRLARPVNILVMGIDRLHNSPDNSPDNFTGNSDTMLLLRLDPTDHSVKMLSIPRDTRVEIPGVGFNKINQANVNGGAALSARVVSRTLNNVQIDRYVRVTTDAFRELVDLVGGIEVFVPRQMSYVDETQKLKIDLSPGWQTLNGDQAEQFARFRNDKNGDIGRVQRQQALLKSLRQRLTNPAVLPRLPQLIRVMWKYVDTNLSLEETLALANFGINLEQDDFKMVLLPGRFSDPQEYIASYWILDSEGRDRIMRQYFGQETTLASVEESRSLSTLRIAIQNATEQPGIAYRVSEYLAAKGFVNVYVVNDWPDRERQTQIIVQQGDLTKAAALKRVLGVGHIEAASIGDLESEITLRVGEDWLDTMKNVQ